MVGFRYERIWESRRGTIKVGGYCQPIAQLPSRVAEAARTDSRRRVVPNIKRLAER
jgi:hypothetical protein